MKIPARAAAFITAAVMILLSILVPAAAEEKTGMNEDGLIYEIRTDADTGEEYAVITDCLYIIPELVIPAEIDGCPVREVAAGFTGLRIGWDTGLEMLTVEEGVRSVGERAFIGCASLREVTLPETLTDIGACAFANCVSLQQVRLPASLAHVGDQAFVNIGMKGLTFPEGVEEARTGFLYCSAIRKDKTGTVEYGLLADGTAVITGYGAASDELVIPETADGIPVTMIARVTIEKIDYTPLRQIKAVTLPAGLKSIRHMAFEHFGGLARITIPEGVETIEQGAFRGCQALGGVELPEGLRRIGEAAFSSCPMLNMPVLPSTLEEIGDQAFYGCTRLSEIKLPESVRTIGSLAFSDCKTKKLALNEGLVSIGYKAFYGNKLTDVVIPASVRRIGDGAFQPADGKFLVSVIVSGMCTAFGKGVFGYDDGWQAFYLEHKDELNVAMTLFDKDDVSNWHDYYADPAYFSQKSINLSCYSGSTADLTYQYFVNKTILQGSAENVVTAPSDRVLAAGLYQPDDMISELIIPEGVEEIADHALEGLGTLTKVTVPSTLVRIGVYAFNQCVGLTEITLPEGLRDVGEGAFKDCWELAKANIPDGITEIRNSVFENCRKLKNLTIPKNGFTRIGNSAFAGCEALSTLKLEKGLEEIGESAFANCGLKEAKIPDTVTSLGRKAFARSGLTKLTLPAGMEEVPEGLCEYATKLGAVQLPKTLKRIGKNAFRWSGLKSVTLPEGLLSIGENAFGVDPDRSLATYRESKGKKKSSELKSVRFPASLTVIEKNAFAGCDSLTSVTFPAKSALEEIGEDAFAMCVRMTKFTAPDSLRKIGNGAFRMCLKLGEVNLGKGITEAGDEAFSGCIGMKTMIVPESLAEIGRDLLKNYGSKLRVTCVDGSAMHLYMQKHYPAVRLTVKKKK